MREWASSCPEGRAGRVGAPGGIGRRAAPPSGRRPGHHAQQRIGPAPPCPPYVAGGAPGYLWGVRGPWVPGLRLSRRSPSVVLFLQELTLLTCATDRTLLPLCKTLPDHPSPMVKRV